LKGNKHVIYAMTFADFGYPG